MPEDIQVANKFADTYSNIIGFEMSSFELLSEEDILYWSRFKRWTVFKAVFLSMGRRSSSEATAVVDQETAKSLGEEFVTRLEMIKQAIACGDLETELTQSDAANEYLEDYEVDAKAFLLWAEKRFNSTCPALSQKVIANYKSTAHSAAGKQKGKVVEEIKRQIQEEAERQLEAGCKCQHSELAQYLLHMKCGGGSLAFPIPVSRNKTSIKPERWFEHVLEATTKAFKAKQIPLRNEPKTEPRGRALCEDHCNWTPQ